MPAATPGAKTAKSVWVSATVKRDLFVHNQSERGPDGAQRNPGRWPPVRKSPNCAALHPGYGLTHLRDLAALIRPRFCNFAALLLKRGRREDRVLAAPAVSCATCTEEPHTSIQVQAEHPGLPCAVALRLTSCSPRRTALLPPSPTLLIADLAPAPRRPNHTTSPYASGACVSRAISVHRISPRVRDVRTPLSSGETGGVKPLICPTTKAKYFCKGTRQVLGDLPVVLFCRI